MKQLYFIFFCIFALYSCSTTPSRPQLFPNEHMKKTDPSQTEIDINQCLKESDDYLLTEEGKKLADSLNPRNFSSAVSLGYGGGSSVFGVGVGTGTRSSSQRLSGKEQVRRNYTNQCLVNRGYQVLGWEN